MARGDWDFFDIGLTAHLVSLVGWEEAIWGFNA